MGDHGTPDEDRARLSFVGRRLPPKFRRWVITVAPGGVRVGDRTVWHDAIVVVERGYVEVVTWDGAHHGFAEGDVLWLAGLPLRTLRNPGQVPAVLVAISRA